MSGRSTSSSSARSKACSGRRASWSRRSRPAEPRSCRRSSRSNATTSRSSAPAEPEVEREDGRTTVEGVSFNFTAEHHVANAAAALAALDALGLPRPDRVEVEFSRWRGEELPLPGGGLFINDAYNANPVSMRAALRQLEANADGRRRVAILGDMAELGSGAPAYHEEIGREAARHGVEVLLAVGELARGYVDGGVPVTSWAPDAETAAAEAAELVRPGDVVLVKASRALGLERVAEVLAAVSA